MKRVAVVGSGVSGLAATWVLNEHADDVEVHLFEADDRPGGHTNTVDFTTSRSSGGPSTRVDTGFIVFNTVTYPNLLQFLELLKLPYIASEMSFSVSRDRGLYEWAGNSLSTIFAQRRNLLDPGQWRMVYDILRFNNNALELLRAGDSDESIGAYLDRKGYSESFRNNYLLPMTAAIWSTPPDTAALDFPALTLLRFMHNHHLLQILDRPVWLTLKNGSYSYVERVLAKLPDAQYHPSTPIRSAATRGGGHTVHLTTEAGAILEFDHVIFACHADTTLAILESGEGITMEEQIVLGGFQFGKNRAVLHADTNLMPRIRSTWAAWNYLTSSDGPKANVNTVALTYWMNLLQSIPESVFGPVLVTLNPPFEPKSDLVVGEWSYDHPLFSPKSIRSQELLPVIQNKRGITFCGAWTKYGFHEDGFTSGLRVATQYLSAESPFPILPANRTLPPPSTNLTALFNVLDLVFAFFAWPWSVLMSTLVVACYVADWFLGVAERTLETTGTHVVWRLRLREGRRVGRLVREGFRKSAGGEARAVAGPAPRKSGKRVD